VWLVLVFFLDWFCKGVVGLVVVSGSKRGDGGG